MKKAPASPSGNRTPVSRVTGGDTHHYTNEDNCAPQRSSARPHVRQQGKVIVIKLQVAALTKTLVMQQAFDGDCSRPHYGQRTLLVSRALVLNTCFCPVSNRGPFACEANVITTTLQKRCPLSRGYQVLFSIFFGGNAINSKVCPALAGNRTRVPRVAGENSTTEPPMPVETSCGVSSHVKLITPIEQDFVPAYIP